MARAHLPSFPEYFDRETAESIRLTEEDLGSPDASRQSRKTAPAVGLLGVRPGPLEVLGLRGRPKQLRAYPEIEAALCSFQHIRDVFRAGTRHDSKLPVFPESIHMHECIRENGAAYLARRGK